MQINIYSSFIQQLMTGKEKDSAYLAASLLSDKKELMAWTWLDMSRSEAYSLPYLMAPLIDEITAYCGKGPWGVHIEDRMRWARGYMETHFQNKYHEDKYL